MFKTIKENVSYELIEKKSKFIANIYYIESIEEAEEKLKEIKKKYYDARHNCYAYSVFTSEGIINRFSDDGEPSGTAGAPMLNILNAKGISNVLVVVTRYFGGILLGTGGLVRAYTGATQEALNETEEICKDLGLEVKIIITYPDLDKLKYYLKQNNIEIINIEYCEEAQVSVDISKDKYNILINADKNKDLNFNIINMETIQEKYIKIG